MSQQADIERTSKGNGAVELEDVNSSKTEQDIDRVLTEDEKKLLKRATFVRPRFYSLQMIS